MNSILRTVLATAALAIALPAAQAATITVNGEWTASDSTVDPRPFRDGSPSSCGATGGFAGVLAGTWPVDTFTFYNNGAASCFTVTHLNNSTNPALFVQAFLGANVDVSNLASLGGVYLGDGGNSGVPSSFSFLAPAYSAFTLAAFSADGLGTYGFSVEGMNLLAEVPKRNDVPEPAGMALLAIAAAAALLSRRRQRG